MLLHEALKYPAVDLVLGLGVQVFEVQYSYDHRVEFNGVWLSEPFQELSEEQALSYPM